MSVQYLRPWLICESKVKWFFKKYKVLIGGVKALVYGTMVWLFLECVIFKKMFTITFGFWGAIFHDVYVN